MFCRFDTVCTQRPFFWLLLAGLLAFVMVGWAQADDPVVVPGVGAPPETAVAGASAGAANAALPADAQSPQMSGHLTFLPLIVSPPSALAGCGLNAEEQNVAALAMSHPDQGRVGMACNAILSRQARSKAVDMAARGYFSHVDPDGYGPNWHVRTAGYNLPSWYGSAPDANNIESIAAGYTTAEAAWDAWTSSAGHRPHVLGEPTFWSSQTNFGVGYYYDANSPYKHYWVFMSAPPE